MSQSENQGFDPDGLADRATEMAAFLKVLGHDGRLAIMCHLGSGSKSVGELEAKVASNQPVVSQHLARLRLEGLVLARREGKTIYYSIHDPKVLELLRLLNRLFRGSDQTEA